MVALRACFAVAVLTAGGVASANPILSNLPANSSGTGTNLGLGIDSVLRTKAVGLTMGAESLDFVSMEVLMSNPSTSPSSNLVGGIYSDVGGNPGGLLAAFTPTMIASGTTAQIFTLTVAGGFTLNAGQTYWFRLDGPNSTNSMMWNSLSPNAAPTGMGANFVGYRFSTNDGASWTNSTIYNGMTINAIPTPGAFGVLAMAGLVSARRRR
ncbi:MAG: hypothetical protein LAT64_10945 [Phycisphaerales bacterium]|nr:hypothetical protein [Planctomycetota bacterium]MCH8509267.1 hypothetical protein [Phycisphaerales bacterium]